MPRQGALAELESGGIIRDRGTGQEGKGCLTRHYLGDPQ
jgi:hypothetical protein